MFFSSTLWLLVGLANVHSYSCYNWNDYKLEFRKVYENPLEETMRSALFNQRSLAIEKFNQQQNNQASFKLRTNHFSDWTREERLNLKNFREEDNKDFLKSEISLKAERYFTKLLAEAKDSDIPKELDWTKVKDVVAPVRDQGKCNSAWAFVSTGGLEGRMKSRNASFVQLSPQQLVDCSKQNVACYGGNFISSFQDIHTMGGIEADKTYPYVDAANPCKFNKSRSVFTDLGGYYCPEGDENTLKKLLALLGPIALAVNGWSDDFMNYSHGVYNEPNCGSSVEDLCCSLLLVGYGTDSVSGLDYWLLRNSWGLDWGMKGYIKMARNRNNSCGVATRATLPYFDE